MWPIEAQRFRLVCSATSSAPSRIFWKSRLESPWPWVTMQNRWAPAASAAFACSRICSGSIIAWSGVSASANRDCAQNPQSSAQPPDFALTSEHMSVESPKRSTRAFQARSMSASMSSRSVRRPRARASSREMSGGMAGKLRTRPDATIPTTGAKSTRSGDFGTGTDPAHWLGRMSPRFVRSSSSVSPAMIRVLLCDDVKAFRSLVRYALEDEEGIEVVGEAADGDEGIRQATELQPDVVLLDLSMPRCDGLEAIPEIARNAPDARIVALSGFAAQRMAE